MTVKHAYTCDDVFEILTAGPFPRGEEGDEAVERHIAVCHECRRLAEAMKPATDLLRESLHESEASGLPRYEGYASAPWNSEGRQTVDDPALLKSGGSPAQSVGVPARRHGFLRLDINFWPLLVAAALFGIGLSMSIEWMQRSRGNEPQIGQLSHVLGTPLRDGVPDDQGKQFLVSLELSSNCYGFDAIKAESGTATEGADFEACCTECHSVGSTSLPSYKVRGLDEHRSLMGRVVGSCGACHASS